MSWTVRFSVAGRANRFCFFSKTSRQVVHEVNHSPPSGSDAMNEWKYTPTSPTCLHDVDRSNITFYFALACALNILVEDISPQIIPPLL